MVTKIKVTLDDIEKGQQKSCARCPVARAVKRVFPGYTVNVQDSVIFLNSQEYVMPFWVRLIVRNYDLTGVMEPFEFNLG